MKDYWKRLNTPAITPIGLIGWLGWFMIVIGEGRESLIGILLMMFAIINYFIRDVFKNK